VVQVSRQAYESFELLGSPLAANVADFQVELVQKWYKRQRPTGAGPTSRGIRAQPAPDNGFEVWPMAVSLRHSAAANVNVISHLLHLTLYGPYRANTPFSAAYCARSVPQISLDAPLSCGAERGPGSCGGLHRHFSRPTRCAAASNSPTGAAVPNCAARGAGCAAR